MANFAFYRMKIKGQKENVEELIRAMNFEEEYEDDEVGRIYDFYVYEKGIEKDEDYVLCEGSCAWSVQIAMRNNSYSNNIENMSKKLNLDIEIYCEETGFAFQEHFCIKKGEIVCDECIDYEEYYEEDIVTEGDDFWEKEIMKEYGVTKENYEEFMDEDKLIVGGYKNWDWLYV